MNRKGDTEMNPNAQTFAREMSQAENEAPVYFKEYKSADHWWHHRRKKEIFADVALFFSLATAGALYFAFATGVL